MLLPHCCCGATTTVHQRRSHTELRDSQPPYDGTLPSGPGVRTETTLGQGYGLACRYDLCRMAANSGIRRVGTLPRRRKSRSSCVELCRAVSSKMAGEGRTMPSLTTTAPTMGLGSVIPSACVSSHITRHRPLSPQRSQLSRGLLILHLGFEASPSPCTHRTRQLDRLLHVHAVLVRGCAQRDVSQVCSQGG